MAKIEDTIQTFLAPDPVRRHKPKTPSNKNAKQSLLAQNSPIAGVVEESKEEGIDMMVI